MHWWAGPAFVYVIAYCQLDSCEQIPVKFKSEFYHCHLKNTFEIVVCQIGDHLSRVRFINGQWMLLKYKYIKLDFIRCVFILFAIRYSFIDHLPALHYLIYSTTVIVFHVMFMKCGGQMYEQKYSQARILHIIMVRGESSSVQVIHWRFFANRRVDP